MLFTSKNVALVQKIEKSEKISNNELLVFLLTLATKRKGDLTGVFKTLFDEDEIQFLKEVSIKNDLLSKKEYDILDKLSFSKQNKSKEDRFEKEAKEAIRHLKSLNPSAAEGREAILAAKRVLQKGFSLENLKYVNYYFSNIWKYDPDMSKYINAVNLYRISKFETKLHQAKPVLDNIKKYREQLKLFLADFTPSIAVDIPPEERKDVVTVNDIPFKIQERFVYWLDSGYSYSVIQEVVRYFVTRYLNKEKGGILSASRILDQYFKNRVALVEQKKILLKIEDQKNKVLEEWAEEDE